MQSILKKERKGYGGKDFFGEKGAFSELVMEYQ